jgi:hypothetical protein
VFFKSTMARESTMEKVSAPFRHFLRPIPNLITCPSCPAAREPISVAILFDLLRKKRVMMEDVNVCHGRKQVEQEGES